MVRAGRGTTLALGLVLLAATAVVQAQLTEKDFDDLQRQGKAEGWTFTVGPNAATDYSLDQLCGLVVPEDWKKGASFDPCAQRDPLPVYFDWRDDPSGGCTPVRNQGGCGSCWAFATVGPLECNILIKDGVSVDLSEQWLVSCNTSGWGCGGGWWAHDYHDWKSDPCGGIGAVFESDFPYVATDAPCNCPYPHEYTIERWSFIGTGGDIPSVDAMKQAILDYGPITAGVYVNSAFQGYTSGVFSGCAGGAINHGVTLVGWDDNQGDHGVWFMRNSWGPGWGEGGYMRIPYNCSSIGYAAAYVDYRQRIPQLHFEFPDGCPPTVPPGGGRTIRVNVSPDDGTPVPGTGRLHCSVNYGQYQTYPMTELAPNEYEATFPAAPCFSPLLWYVSAEESTGHRVYDPPEPTSTPYTARVATGREVVLDDPFETNLGWTVTAGASLGNWERGDPEQVLSGGVITQPGDDHSENGTLCYVTGRLAGSSASSYDVDGGPTRLTSPVFDLEGTDGVISYWRWFHMSTQMDDELLVELSLNGGASWYLVERVNTRQEWTYVEFTVGDLYLTPTSQVRVRFTVDDTPNNSLLEALLDDFRVERFTCHGGPIAGDMNCDGELNNADIPPFVMALIEREEYDATYDCNADSRGDFDGDGVLTNGDIPGFIDALAGE